MYDLPKERSSLEHEIEYILLDEFLMICKNELDLDITEEERLSLIQLVGKRR